MFLPNRQVSVGHVRSLPRMLEKSLRKYLYARSIKKINLFALNKVKRYLCKFFNRQKCQFKQKKTKCLH